MMETASTKVIYSLCVVTIFFIRNSNSFYVDHASGGNRWNTHAVHNLKIIGRSRDAVGSFSSSKTNSSVCREDNGQFADSQYCDKYYDCWEGEPVSSGQCPHGLMFNEQISSCDYPANVDCNGKEVAQPPQDLPEGCEEAYGTFPNRYYCDQYTVCHAGIAVYHRCEPGLAFDEHLGMCSPPPGSPSCLDGGPPEDQPEIPLDPDNIKPRPPSGPSVGGGGDGGIAFPIIPDGFTTSCPTKESGFIPIVNDCQGVLVCINGNGFLFQCPKGEYYFPREAKCRLGPSGQCEQMKFIVSNVRNLMSSVSFKNSIQNLKLGYFWKNYPLVPSV